MTDYSRAEQAKDLPKTTSWLDYAREICRTGDLDPVYVALRHSGWHDNQIKRFVIGLITFYSKCEAAYLSQFSGRRFWQETLKRYPIAKRKPMRRHFRGQLGLKALDSWMSRWPEPELMAEELMMQPADWKSIRNWTKGVPQLGNYFTWKVADLYEVLYDGLISVNFDGCGPFMAGKSEKGLKTLLPHMDNETGLARLRSLMKDQKAPPYYGRPVDKQEIETTCCNWPDVIGKGYTMGQTIAQYIADAETLPTLAGKRFVDSLLGNTPFSRAYIDQIILNKGYK